MLRHSIPEWNSLRRRHPSGVPNLSSVDLEGADLGGADLRQTDLRGAYFSGAKLARADLRGADLRRAHLADADLSEADLRGADLRGADLRGAHLLGARIERASLAGTILDPACWARPLLQLWSEASDEKRLLLVQALESKTALHGRWQEGTEACPEAILSGRGAETDDFMLAWNTYGISEEQVLQVVQGVSPRPAGMERRAAMAARAGGAG